MKIFSVLFCMGLGVNTLYGHNYPLHSSVNPPVLPLVKINREQLLQYAESLQNGSDGRVNVSMLSTPPFRSFASEYPSNVSIQSAGDLKELRLFREPNTRVYCKEPSDFLKKFGWDPKESFFDIWFSQRTHYDPPTCDQIPESMKKIGQFLGTFRIYACALQNDEDGAKKETLEKLLNG